MKDGGSRHVEPKHFTCERAHSRPYGQEFRKKRELILDRRVEGLILRAFTEFAKGRDLVS
jgi:hypothetical protein